ncbi:glycosyltransferase [Dactylosporangium sp. CS-033363]|uniref:glycosyltransferase n=1 Tax=Dactylosporangium sp. CS-033363 TaxID=3239935 RepID=UPI003D8E031C
MRVILSTYDSRGGVEPLAALALRLRAMGAEAIVCAPPDCAARLDELGVPLVPVGRPAKEIAHGERPAAPDVQRIAAGLIAAQFDGLAAAAQGCDAIVTSGLLPVAAGARSVAELLKVPAVNVSYCPIFLPSPHHRPSPLPGRPVPAEVHDPDELDAIDVANHNAFLREPLNEHRAAAGLPPVDDVRAFVRGEQPWLAADPTLAPWPGGADIVQTGAWFLRDERPLPSEVDSFLQAGTPPVYVSFGSMPAPAGFATSAISLIRAAGHRAIVGRGWAELAGVDDDADCLVIGEVNQQHLFRRVAAVVHHGGAGTTTTATRAGVPQVVVPQWADQPYFADRVTALGIGSRAATFGDALRTALAPEVRERATAVAATIRTDGASTASRLLLNMS